MNTTVIRTEIIKDNNGNLVKQIQYLSDGAMCIRLYKKNKDGIYVLGVPMFTPSIS